MMAIRAALAMSAASRQGHVGRREICDPCQPLTCVRDPFCVSSTARLSDVDPLGHDRYVLAQLAGLAPRHKLAFQDLVTMCFRGARLGAFPLTLNRLAVVGLRFDLGVPTQAELVGSNCGFA